VNSPTTGGRSQVISKEFPETGMDFQIVQTSLGLIAVLEDGAALPYYDDLLHYDINDLIAGNPISTIRDSVSLNVSSVFPNRAAALIAMQAANISHKYTGSAGAFPFIASDVLAVDTIFYRYLNSPADPRYVAGKLTAGAYLTTVLDQLYANSGFATVGRFALPMPLPASHVIQYELKKGAAINIGTVAPMFGQAGGGVEVAQSAIQVGTSVVADY